MGPFPLRLDVTDALPRAVAGSDRMSIAAWLFVPERVAPSDPPAVISLLNGGTYDKRYFHVEIPGHPGYSMAEHLCALGDVVILLDHLGVGESSRAADQMLVTRQVAALANHAAMLQIYERLKSGDLHPSLPALPRFRRVGGGHSMGGMQTITQQAEFGTYDAVAILGYTAIGVHLTVAGALVSADPGELDRSQTDYSLRDRSFLRSTFHWEDVPAEVLAADDALLVEVPYVLSAQSITAGIVAEDAARIATPVYICLGERDVSPDPHAEPALYRRSQDITLHILPRSAHCENFASTRAVMWDRLHAWSRSLAI
jgi:alpha-beta hydrolase superfamily lysophospholipase